MKTESKRKYHVAMAEGGENLTIRFLTIDQILFLKDRNPYEHLIALTEIQDKILDLRIGETLIFQPIRDNYDTKGILMRVE